MHRRYGGPEVLQIGDLPRPEPGDDDILIRVRAAEVTKGDCEMRSFRFAVKWFWLPLRLALGVFRPRRPVLGNYFAGTVVAVGANVSRFSAGDNVFGCSKLMLGAYAQFLCVPSSYTVAHMPANLSHEQAAAVPLGGLNALHFMRRASIAPGESVLVNGAGGSIGSFAVQLALNLGTTFGAGAQCAHRHDFAGNHRFAADHYHVSFGPRFADGIGNSQCDLSKRDRGGRCPIGFAAH